MTEARRAIVRSGTRADRAAGILRATLEELASVGYRALSIEDVAAKSGVNKTTVYRRWPTKKDLVHAALSSVADEQMVAPDTGSVRRDLLAMGRAFVELASSILGQSLFRVLALESAEPELEAISTSMRERREKTIDEVIARAVARGELLGTTDPKVLLPTLIGALHLKLFFKNECVDDAFICRVIELLLVGATPRAAAASGASVRSAARSKQRRIRAV